MRSWQRPAGRALLQLGRRYAAPPPPVAEDPFKLLELQPGTRDESEVRAAFRRLSKVYHPDVPETGDVEMFQRLQQAAEQLLDADGPPGSGEPFDYYSARKTSFAPNRDSKWAPPNVGHTPSVKPQDAKAVGDKVWRQRDSMRVTVEAVTARKSPGLSKLADLPGQARPATPAVLSKVQQALGNGMGVPVDQVLPELPVDLILPMEGKNNIGAQVVANTMMDIEDIFGVELVTVMVGTWVRSKVPKDVRTVQDLADLLEGKAVRKPADEAAPPTQAEAEAPANGVERVVESEPEPPRPSSGATASSLPAPWEEHWSEDYQRPFYWNPETQESSWDAASLPGRAEPGPAASAAEQDVSPDTTATLPSPWEEHWSNEYQRPWYWNPHTQESAWERPN